MTNFDKILEIFHIYDYEKVVYDDLLEHVKEWLQFERETVKESESLEELKDEIEVSAWNADNVTGNASGNYWFSRFKAEIALVGNSSLYKEAIDEYGTDFDEEPEKRDTTIRCYLLVQLLPKVLRDPEVTEIYDEIKEGK